MESNYFNILSGLIFAGLAGCAIYDSDNPPDDTWNPLTLEEVLETPGTVVGRIWVSPNPIVFGSNGAGYPGHTMDMDIANIGSEDVVIDKITISGDPDFDFYDPVDQEERSPHTIGGDPKCTGMSGMGFPVVYAETTSDDARANMTVHTSDPTSPTFSVPIYRDESVVYDDICCDPHENVHPMVKPNPIRIDRDEVQSEFQIEVCLGLSFGGDQQARLLELRAYPEDFSVGDILDYYGNTVALPVPKGEVVENPSKAVVSYRPSQEGAEDGALVVRFEDNHDRIRVLVVPIFVR